MYDFICTLFLNLELFKKLIEENNIDVNAQDNGDVTLLDLAVREHNLDIINYLLDKGADPYMSNDWNETPISIAITKNYIDIIKLFIIKGVKLDHRKIYARKEYCNNSVHVIKYAIDYNRELLELLLKNGSDYSFLSDKDKQICEQILIDSKNDI